MPFLPENATAVPLGSQQSESTSTEPLTSHQSETTSMESLTSQQWKSTSREHTVLTPQQSGSTSTEPPLSSKPEHTHTEPSIFAESNIIDESTESLNLSNANSSSILTEKIYCELDRETVPIVFNSNTLKMGSRQISENFNPLILEVSDRIENINFPYSISCRTLRVEMNNNPFTVTLLEKISTFPNIEKLLIVGTLSCNMSLQVKTYTTITFPNLKHLEFRDLKECVEFYAYLADFLVMPKLVNLEFHDCLISEWNIDSHRKIAANVNHLFYFNCTYKLTGSKSKLCSNMRLTDDLDFVGKLIRCERL